MLDPLEYYSQGRFMTVDNNVHHFLRRLQKHASSTISLLHMQLLAAAYQHAVLRDAYAIAKALGRILVLPPVYAWCDWDPAPTVLITCAALNLLPRCLVSVRAMFVLAGWMHVHEYLSHCIGCCSGIR